MDLTLPDVSPYEGRMRDLAIVRVSDGGSGGLAHRSDPVAQNEMIGT